MARSLNKLTARSVATLPKGRYSDGGGLYLVVDEGGARRWAFIFRWKGKQPVMGLGPVKSVPLARARELAAEARASVAAGVNPIEKRRDAEAERKTVTFGEFADAFVATKEAGWRNAKHRAQWAMTLRHYAAPLRLTKLDEIGVDDVLGVLTPIWQAKPETASRLRGRIERVLDAARVKGLRSGENPARWRGHLEAILPKAKKLSRGHHAAMTYEALPAFIERLRERPAIAALALEFAILTATRTSEALGAQWAEIDLEARLWSIPGVRMKAGKEHRIPLSERAHAILSEAEKLRVGAFVFSGQRLGKPLSNMAFLMLLRRMGHGDLTAHGFRSTFRDWCGEATSFPREIAEAALAHAVGDLTERSYRRLDALEKRREMMSAWARFCEPKTATSNSNIVELRDAVR